MWTRPITLSLVAFAALVLAACSQGSADNGSAEPASLDEVTSQRHWRLYERCLNDDLRACERLREQRTVYDSDLYDVDDMPRDYLIHLRNRYAEKCGGGDEQACRYIRGPLIDLGQIKAGYDSVIDDGDRFLWRACLIQQAKGGDQNMCANVFGGTYHASVRPENYAESLRADHAAGGQEGLLARVTDGAVTGTVPNIDPDAVTYSPPAINTE